MENKNKKVVFKDGTELDRPELFYTTTGFYFDRKQVSKIAEKVMNDAIQTALATVKNNIESKKSESGSK